MFQIKEITADETYAIRHKILRPHQTIEDCKYGTDNEENAFHVGAFYQGQLVSVASFCTESLVDFSHEKQYRLRAMATLDEFRRLGAGRAIVNYAESIIKEKGIHFLWCKGRTGVREYYSKLGFTVHGEEFDYPPIGLHILMIREI